MHQAWSTGFFTSAFGRNEAFFLYGIIFTGMVGPLARLVTGRRNIARIPEIVASIFWILGLIWLFNIFPFDFRHFADVIPTFLQFPIKLIVTNEMAQVLLLLGIAGGIVFAMINAGLYLRVRKLLQAQHYAR